MKYKFLALFIILCLALCACNNAGEEAPVTGDPSTPAASVTDGETTADSATDPTDADAEPTDKGLFTTDPEFSFTLPSHIGPVELPMVDFEDMEGVASSRPLDETVEEDTEPTETEATVPPSFSGDSSVSLPFHEWEE